MTTERIDIQVREDGSRVVKRNLDDIATSADKVGRSVTALKRILTGVAATIILKATYNLVEEYQKLQNRLGAVGLQGTKLTAVYKDLVQVSNDTRSSVKGTVELFARLALSTKELGVNQQQLIGFTKSVNHAILLSGASAKEAENGLIQLSQGMASNRLSGDELRSVLEQLPIVADVIAKRMGVTRGELRKLGAEGKITAKVILDAFQDAAAGLDERFKNLTPTISQAFVILRNNLVTAVGELATATGIIPGVAHAVTTLADNIGGLVRALWELAKVLTVVGTAYLAMQASLKVGAIVDSIQQWVAFRKAVAAGNVVILGSAEANRQKAVFTAQAAAADAAAAGHALRLAAAEEALATSKLLGVRATQSLLIAERNLELVRLKAQISAIGRTMSLTRLAEIRLAEANLTKLVAREEAALAVATSARAAAQGAATAASATATAASAGAAAATARAAGTTSLFSQALIFARTQVLRLYAVLAANPITAIVTALAAAVTALTIYRDKILLGIDSTTTFGDLMRALGERISTAFNKVSAALDKTFGPIFSKLREMFGEIDFSLIGIMRASAITVDTMVGLFRGAIAAIVVLFKSLGKIISDTFSDAFGGLFTKVVDVFSNIIRVVTTAFEFISTKIRQFVENAVELLNRIGKFLNLDQIQLPKLEIDVPVPSAVKKIGQDMGDAFKDGFQKGAGALDFVNELAARAKLIGDVRTPLEEVETRNKSDSPWKNPPAPVDQKAIDRLKESLNDLRGQYDSVRAAQMLMEESTVILDKGIKAGLISGGEAVRIYDRMQFALRDQLDPMAAMHRAFTEETNLLGMNSKEREIQIAYLAKVKELQQSMGPLNAAQLLAIKNETAALHAQNEASQIRDSLLANSAANQAAGFDAKATVMAGLVNDPTSQFTQGDATESLNAEGPFAGMFEGTQAMIDVQLDRFREMYVQINKLEEDRTINEQTAAALRAKVAAEEAAVKLSTASTFFNNLSSLSESKNRALAAIGKASAITEATIAGYLAVQRSLAAPPGWPYNAASVISTGVMQATNVAKIAGVGFQAGGYTGNGGVSEAAGVVHGREYVMDAEATSRIGVKNLDAMRAGRSAGVGDVHIEVKNLGTPQTYRYDGMSEGKVRMIAQDVADATVDARAPDAVGSALNDPNSRVSKSFASNIQAQRKR